MNIMDYIGLPYDITCNRGHNCWSLYKHVIKKELGIESQFDYKDRSYNKEDIAVEFSSALETHQNNHIEVDVSDAKNFDLIVLSKKEAHVNHFHCGVWYNKKMLHAKGSGRKGQVWYDELAEYATWNMRIFRHVNN